MKMLAVLTTGAVFVALLVAVSESREIVIGAMMFESSVSRSSSFGYYRTASAINIALDRVRKEGLLGNNTVRVVTAIEKCLPKLAIAHLIGWKEREDIDVIIGPACSFSMIAMGLYVSVWNLPWFPYGGIASDLSDKKTYNTLVRVIPLVQNSAIAVVRTLEHFKWRRVSILSSEGHCQLTVSALVSIFRERDIVLADRIHTTTGMMNDMVNVYLDRLKLHVRIVFLCLVQEEMATFIYRAYERGMSSPDFVFLTTSTVPSARTYRPWGDTLQGPTDPRQAAWLSLKQITATEVTGPQIDQFYHEIMVRLTEPPWNVNYSYDNNLTGSFQGAVLHDTTYLYFLLLNETLEEGGDWRNGTLLFEKAKNRRFEGIAGPLLMDKHADCIRDHWLWSVGPGESVMTHVLLLQVTANVEVEYLGEPYWGTPDNQPPPDTPLCGFQNEFCPEDSTARTVIAVTAPVGTVCLVLLILGYVAYFRRRQHELELQRMLWKVDFAQIQRLKVQSGSAAVPSFRSLRSSRSSTAAEMEWVTGRQIFMAVGLLRGVTVAIRKVGNASITLTNDDLLELKEMRDMTHENVNAFIGACIDPPNTCYLMQYCQKGSLQDILENDDIKLDWLFKSSLISDLANGMMYLHRSKLQSHGHLTSSTCLVDSRWVLKVSCYGLGAFRRGDHSDDANNSYQKYRKLLWTAPELLRMPVPPFYGTQKGDVFSFAIILHEVVYRRMPYSGDTTTPKETIERIIKAGKEPYRPSLETVESDTNSKILDTIQMCWAEDPNIRPDFQVANKKLRQLNAGRNVNIMDSMISKMEAYANNLEEIVDQRTGELYEEKKKTDKLLYRMLPEVVAERLKQGRAVQPVFYSSVTIFFSDIVGFTSLSSESTPMQIVDLLNDLYTLFDDIISLHDVYKVETIGDAYMVVSGLPEPNGERHASEIATMSLDLLSAVTTSFRVRHLPDRRLKLRCGLHTGPCAAGVVGLTMPRYCLFGDTVNMASRMESNGEALKIHLSEATYAALKKASLYVMVARGKLEIKGKGQQTTYWLNNKIGYTKPLPV